MIQLSAACSPCLHATKFRNPGAVTTAFIQLLTWDLFQGFPSLEFIIAHGGGALSYHWSRFRGIAQNLGKRTTLRSLPASRKDTLE